MRRAHSRPRPSAMGAWVTLATLALSGGTHAQQPDDDAATERSSSLSWVRMPGTETCLASAALARAVEAQLSRRVFVSAADADLVVEGRAERVGRTWRAVIVVSEPDGSILGERTIESGAASCEPLGELVTVAVALMIDPLTATPALADTSEDTLAATGEETREPTERVIVRTERVEVPAPPGPRWRVEIDASLVGSLGLSPHPNLGGMSAVVVEPPDFVPFALHGAIFPFARAGQGGAHADFLHVHLGVQICPLGLREGPLALHGCLGVDVGAVVVVGGTVELDERERVIGQGHLELRGHWDVAGPLTLRAGAHLLVPFRQDDPLTIGGVPFFAPEPVAAMLDLGVGLHFE